LDDGATWTHFNKSLPAAPVSWITVEPRYHDVIISTYGRGIFILENISMLEQTGEVAPRAMTSGIKLYAVRPGFRQARSGSVEFVYNLPGPSAGPLSIEILDGAGQVIRHLSVPGQQG